MNTLAVQQLVERLENDHEHGLTIDEWVAVLWTVSEEHTSRPCPYPVQFSSFEHQFLTYCNRAGAGVDLKHPDDVPPPPEDPDDEWNDDPADVDEDEPEGSPGLDGTHQAFVPGLSPVDFAAIRAARLASAGLLKLA